MSRSAVGIVVGAAIALTFAAGAGAQTRILYLSKSAGYEHSVVKREGDQPSLTDKILTQLAKEHGAEITCTKDAGLINAENLKNYDLVIFYTTGVLTEAGDRGEPPMGETGVQDLIEWIRNGGGFVGFHAATDTFGTPEGQEPNDFTKLIGGTFGGHGAQFEGTVKVVDPGHPAVASLPAEWTILEEWYTFRNLDEENMHVLALFEPGEERTRQEMYNVPAYPIVWCKTLGSGRIYYNALGHRESVWNDPVFQACVVDAASWALGEGPARAEPNYGQVVPKEIAPAASE